MRPEWGFTRQVEDGWKATTQPFVLFLNDDCIVNRDALWTMLLAMTDPKVGIVGPSVPCGDFQADPRLAPEPYTEVRHLIGACLLVRREVLERIGGWDTEFVLHCSDLDLCIRAQEAGYKVVWASEARVGHTWRATISEMPDETRREIVAKDHWLFARKHPSDLTQQGVKALMHLTAAQPAA